MTTPTRAPRTANTDLVTVAWLKLATPLGIGQVATQLPPADVVRSLPHFCRVRTGIGSLTPADGLVRRPVVQIECWSAPDEGSQKVPWGPANDLAELVYSLRLDRDFMDRVVQLVPTDYGRARVHTVNMLEPRRIEGDPSGWARFDVDATVNWTREE